MSDTVSTITSLLISLCSYCVKTTLAWAYQFKTELICISLKDRFAINKVVCRLQIIESLTILSVSKQVKTLFTINITIYKTHQILWNDFANNFSDYLFWIFKERKEEQKALYIPRRTTFNCIVRKHVSAT